MYPCCALHKAGPILDSEGMSAFFGGTFFRKKSILLASAPQADAIFNHFYQKYFFQN